MSLDKNISVWRGDTTPPTIYHLWVKEGTVFAYFEDKWVNITLPDITDTFQITKDNKLDLSETFKDGISDMSQSIKDINNLLYTNYSQVTLSASPTIIEKDVASKINLSWAFKYDGKEETPTTMVLRSGDTVLESYAKSFTDTITNTKSYQVTAEYKGVDILSNVVTVNAYYPIYTVVTTKPTITPSDITSGVKKVASSPNGSYNVAFTNSSYVWFCVPSGMSINKATLSGFAFPLETSVNITVTGKGTYKCYRSTNTNDAGNQIVVLS